jgi:ferric-dicitrate binding protein FerR (iron transport regulator)
MLVTDELIDRVLDGETSEDEVAEVLRWLELPDNLARFARRAELHADLRRSLRRRTIQAAALKVCDEQTAAAPEAAAGSSRPTLPARPGLVVGMAALVAACLLLVLYGPEGDPIPNDSRPDAASVVSGVGFVLMKDEREWNGAGLPVGEYRLDDGLLNLQFDGGVMVFLEAPTRFEAVSGKRLVLHAGRLSVTVPPEGVGFTVGTREADIIDFGTEFSVEAQSGASEVHVFQGLVRVQPKARKGLPVGEPVDLKTSQAITIDDAARKPVEIELATDGFIRNFDEPQKKYCRAVKDLKPAAYYRMPISKGFPCEPPEYSGELLGDGSWSEVDRQGAGPSSRGRPLWTEGGSP